MDRTGGWSRRPPRSRIPPAAPSASDHHRPGRCHPTPRGSALVAIPGWNRAARYLTGEPMNASRATQRNRRENHGRLEARRVEVVAGGRGAATKERRAALWLPGPAVVWGSHADQPRHERYVRAVGDEAAEDPLEPSPDAGQGSSAVGLHWRGR